MAEIAEIIREVWQSFHDLYEKFPSLDFGTPLPVDMFCDVCGNFLTVAYEDSDQIHKCRFCLKCYEKIKNLTNCPTCIHEKRTISKQMMVKKVVNQNPTNILIICPYKCGSLYTVLKLRDHVPDCKNRPKESCQELYNNGATESSKKWPVEPVVEPSQHRFAPTPKMN